MDTGQVDTQPSLDSFFDGRVEADGYVESRGGAVKRLFTARFDGAVTDTALKIDEELTYADGETLLKHWDLTRVEGGYDGRCSGLVGPVHIEALGDGRWLWRYAMDVMAGRRKIRVQVEDLMVRTAPDTLLSHTKVRKFGLTVARVIIAYRKGR